MPKKTRKEKIIAYYRRQIKILKQAQVGSLSQNLPASPQEKTEIIPESKESFNIPKTEEKKEEVKLKKFFYEDFKKSLILSSLIIAFELLLFFVKIIK